MVNEAVEKRINRNSIVLDKTYDSVKDTVVKHIQEARMKMMNLELLDYDVREETIKSIISQLDNDYELMGFTLEEEKEGQKSK